MELNQIKSLSFFFILGRPRSGTTLLRLLLDAHPNILIPPETRLILNLYEKYGKIKKWNPKKLLFFYNDLLKQDRFDTWPINKEKLLYDLLVYKDEISFQKLIKVVYSNYISFFDKEKIILLGDKTPNYSLNAKKIFKIFPHAKYIELVRDYRSHILSMKNAKIGLPITSIIAYNWKYSVKTINNLQNRYPHQFLTVRYEDLVENPSSELKKICDFLELDYKPEMLEFYKKKEVFVNYYLTDEFKKYHKKILSLHNNLFKPINPSGVNLWKTKMPEKDIKIADLVVGKYAELLGYNRKYKKFNFWFPLKILPEIMYIKLFYSLRFVVDNLPYNLKMQMRSRKIIAPVYFKLFRR